MNYLLYKEDIHFIARDCYVFYVTFQSIKWSDSFPNPLKLVPENGYRPLCSPTNRYRESLTQLKRCRIPSSRDLLEMNRSPRKAQCTTYSIRITTPVSVLRLPAKSAACERRDATQRSRVARHASSSEWCARTGSWFLTAGV